MKVELRTVVWTRALIQEEHMHNETKVNTNDGETSSVDEKKIAASYSWVEHVVDLDVKLQEVVSVD